MAVWNEKYQIGNGEKTTEEDAPFVYRKYRDCGIEIDERTFNEIAQIFKIYYATNELKDIKFTPKDVLKQTISNYYFMHLQVKFPKKQE